VKNFQYNNLEAYRNLPDLMTIGVSGGRSSAYQMAHILEANGKPKSDWVFVFENTSLERPETYDFLQKLDNYFGLGLNILEWDMDKPKKYRRVDFASMKRNGEIFEDFLTRTLKRRDGTIGVRPLPNPAQRTCTANLKIKTVHRFVRDALGWPTQYYAAIGYRADEKSRCDKRWLQDEIRGFDTGGMGVFPMFDAGATIDHVDNFFLHGPFNLKIDSIFGNCDFCFMASTWKIKERMMLVAFENQIKLRPGAVPPERVLRWILWEERVSDRPGRFRKDRPSMREIWNQVCEGDMQSCVPEGKDDRCGSCTD